MEMDWPNGLEVLNEATCWDLLQSVEIGRLGMIAAGQIEVWPMNFAAVAGVIRLRTEPGSKLAALTEGPVDAVFEVDMVSERWRLGWSVIVRGTLRQVTDPAEASQCDLLKLQAWSDAARPNWLTLDPSQVTGRRIVRGPQEFTD